MMVYVCSPYNPCSLCNTYYGHTCCQVAVTDGPRFPLTLNEVRRIQDHLRIEGIKQLAISKKVSKEEQDAMRKVLGFDVDSLYMDDWAFYLKVDSDNKCLYLTDSGCSIPKVKPYICSSFPFHVTVEGNVKLGYLVKNHGYCYGQDMAQDLDHALTMFGETKESLKAKRLKWEKDLEANKQIAKNWEIYKCQD
jgi:Fe-S-cluster containining protein